MFLLLLILSLLGPSANAAQQRSARKPAPTRGAQAAKTPTRWPIETLTVQGNRVYTQDQILAVAGLKVGQLAGKEEFEAAQKRLEATGAFETIGYRFAPGPNSRGYAASFQVVEVEPVYPVRFENLGVPEGDLEAWLKSKNPLFGPQVPGTAAMLNRYARSIEEYLASQSKREKVIGKLRPVGPDQFTIVFRPDRPEAVVAEVSFAGNKVIPTTELQNAFSGVAIGVPYNEQLFRQLLANALRPLYDARGRIRVAFPKITTEPARDVEGLTVHVTVSEGPSFTLGKVQLDNKSVVKTTELTHVANFKSGDLADFDRINQGLERIRKRLNREGYMRVATRVDRHIDDAKKIVALTVHIDEGPQFFFGRLTVDGLDLNGEAAIRKLWGLQQGKPFNADYPNYFLDQVRSRGLFDNLHKTRSKIDVNEQSHIVNVTLYFQ